VPGFSFLQVGLRNDWLQGFSNVIHFPQKKRFAMTPETEGKEEKGPSGLPFINDPGNEDPGSLMDDATVPLNDSDEADMEYEEDEDEQ
jgi:hypothetical protein